MFILTPRFLAVAAFATLPFVSPIVPLAAAAGDEPTGFRGLYSQYKLTRPVKPPPMTPIVTGGGGVTNLAKFRGKVVLVNFWATWCVPCVQEMPALDRLNRELGGEGLVVLPLSIDEGRVETVKPFYKKLGLETLQIYVDPNKSAYKAFGAWGLPMSYIIDRDGNLRGLLEGAAEWDSEESKTFIRYYLTEEKKP